MVPDRVSRWFGAGGENLGEEQDTQKGVSIVGGVISKGDTFGRFAANKRGKGKGDEDEDTPDGKDKGGNDAGDVKPTSGSDR